MISMACHVINIHAPATNWLLKHVHFNILNIFYFYILKKNKSHMLFWKDKAECYLTSDVSDTFMWSGHHGMGYGAAKER